MQMAVTNASGATLASLAEKTSKPSGAADSPFFVTATGGAIEGELPYPFSHVRDLANASTKTLPVNFRDFGRRAWDSQAPAQEWNDLVKSGKVTIVFTDIATDSDVEEAFIAEA